MCAILYGHFGYLPQSRNIDDSDLPSADLDNAERRKRGKFAADRLAMGAEHRRKLIVRRRGGNDDRRFRLAGLDGAIDALRR